MLESLSSARSSTLPRLFLETLLVALLFATFARTFVAQGVVIPTPSMRPALEVGDHLLVNRLVYLGGNATTLVPMPWRGLRRGDVVVVRSPANPGTLLVKRCIGLPNERLEILDGQVLIDGERLDERGYRERRLPARIPDLEPLRIPPEHYFLLGDNRSDSVDSRTLGSFARDALVGRVVMIYWSSEPRRSAGGASRGPFQRVWDLVPETRWGRTFQLVR